MIIVFCVICACIAGWMVIEAHLHRVVLNPVRLKGQIDNLQLLFISDVHNRRIQKKKLEQVDAVIIGGDFCDKRTSLKKLQSNLAVLASLGPVYFIWGNNDREFGEQALRAVLQQYGVVIVENDAVQLIGRTNRTWIAAIDDTSTKNYSFKRALQKCAQEDIVFCVSHNPQVFEQALPYKCVSMFFGGHLHGGQIRFGPFGIHPHGSFSVRKGIPTLISNGYGTTLLPMRFMARPEIHVVNITIKSGD